MNTASEYAQAGVDYSKIEPFKRAMIKAGSQTLKFPNRRGVYVNEDLLHSHGAVYEFRRSTLHQWSKTTEGLGNLNWIAEWMYQKTGTSYYDRIARALALIIAVDVIAEGAMPCIFEDEVASGDSDWFNDELRSEDFARGCVAICEELGMALPAGESSSLRYLVKSEGPVKSAPVLSGSITGIIAPKRRLITGKNLKPGCVILGSPSSGLHANGISLVIKRALELPEQFLTKLPGGRTLGEECLIPMQSYVGLVEALLNAEVQIDAILPGTGDGVGKLAFDSRPFTYRIINWVPIPPLFQYIESLGVQKVDMLKTFNMGVGLYLFLPTTEVSLAIEVARNAGRQLVVLGHVEEGPRQTIFGPEGFEPRVLPPPGQ